MADNIIGRVTPIWRGSYSNGVTYDLNDIVIDSGGSVWWHKGRDKTTGIAPASGTVWAAVIDMTVFDTAIQQAIATAQEALRLAQEAVSEVTTDVERAETAAQNAETSAQAAARSATAAGTSAGSAASSASSASASAQSADEDAQSAADSAIAAAGSASAAEASATAASGSASAAAASAASAASAVTEVEQRKAAAIQAIDAEGAEVLASIPADYTALSSDVAVLKARPKLWAGTAAQYAAITKSADTIYLIDMGLQVSGS